MRNFIANIFGFSKEIEELNSKVNILGIEISNLEKELLNYKEVSERTLEFRNNKIKYLTEENESLKEKIEYGEYQLKEEKDLESYLNNKYPKINRTYIRHDTTGTHYIDVRNFIMPYDSTFPKITGKDYDDVALKCLNWVIANFKYKADSVAFGFNEYWSYPYQSLHTKQGDCDSGAILLASIMQYNGIPYYRIRLNAGSVNGGGHCYVSYCRETDNQFVVLDWCYFVSKKPIKDRPTHKEERNYINKEKNYYIWFSWNQKFAFGENRLPEELENKFK